MSFTPSDCPQALKLTVIEYRVVAVSEFERYNEFEILPSPRFGTNGSVRKVSRIGELKFHVLSLGDFASKGQISELFIFSLVGEEKRDSFLRKIILYEANCWSYVFISSNRNCGIAFVAQEGSISFADKATSVSFSSCLKMVGAQLSHRISFFLKSSESNYHSSGLETVNECLVSINCIWIFSFHILG